MQPLGSRVNRRRRGIMGATVRTKLLWGTLTGVFALGVVTAIAAQKFLPDQNAAAGHVAAPTPADDDEAGGQPIDIPVKTIHPKRDPSFIISVQELASVEPYYRADLRARVAGPIKFIAKDIGGRVTRGEVLAEIDVPDAVHAVEQKEAVILQREREVDLARAEVKKVERDI